MKTNIEVEIEKEFIMSNKPVLVVMAAGMGSRYGGLKQIDPIGPKGEAILDYSIYDAIEAGFETVVLVIKKSIEAIFTETVLSRLKLAPVTLRIAYQELENVPHDFTVPDGRTKPWGTGHAVLCAKEAIGSSPFAVINADDYYGKTAYRLIYNYLATHEDAQKHSYCMVGYEIGKTVTENGYVSRGVCEIDALGNLISVVERTRIEQTGEQISYTLDEGSTWHDLDKNTIVSMNMWGFTPSLLTASEARFEQFLEKMVPANPLKAEFFLPTTVSELLNEDKATVKVLSSPDQWYGVTYAEDKQIVKDALKTMMDKGMYPHSLWQK